MCEVSFPRLSSSRTRLKSCRTWAGGSQRERIFLSFSSSSSSTYSTTSTFSFFLLRNHKSPTVKMTSCNTKTKKLPESSSGRQGGIENVKMPSRCELLWRHFPLLPCSSLFSFVSFYFTSASHEHFHLPFFVVLLHIYAVIYILTLIDTYHPKIFENNRMFMSWNERLITWSKLYYKNNNKILKLNSFRLLAI